MVRVFILLLCFSVNAWGILYKEINIEEMRDDSDIIFAGTVISESDGVVEGRQYVETTFKVLQWYGASPQTTVTIRQLANQNAKQKRQVFPGLPILRKGQHYLMFLPSKSAYGFASPTGLLTFTLFAKDVEDIKNAKASVQAIPNREAKGLFDNIQNPSIKALVQSKGLSTKVQKKTPIGLDLLEQIIMEKK